MARSIVVTDTAYAMTLCCQPLRIMRTHESNFRIYATRSIMVHPALKAFMVRDGNKSWQTLQSDQHRHRTLAAKAIVGEAIIAEFAYGVAAPAVSSTGGIHRTGVVIADADLG